MAKLFFVGTPIGNLEDLSFRAKKCLEEVDVIFCEDTRVCQKLLNYLKIKKPLQSYHNFNEFQKAKVIQKLVESEQKNVALLTDAGLPLISDPGFVVLNIFINLGLAFEFITGPSAFVLAWLYSGFGFPSTFEGFVLSTPLKRKKKFLSLKSGVFVFFVSPREVKKVLEEIVELEKSSDFRAQIYLAKELTKIHQRHFRGSAAQILEEFKEQPKGEFTLVLKVLKTKRVPKQNKYLAFSKVSKLEE